ncbi:GatB/YqeY domain-containing protein [Arthrobacter sp.]|uniref:GatB/YqeY domain-containing protein n=1 Tax=Arthrobacter sp. TaxID=1667 RepID=UPI0026DF1DBB|nr:GatB/YqeY domain-containing protein [Arthrobacter sp.]MDO5754186.1 GatB/YqeY domain-containing protein [Arthrobacter sp.]
MSALKQQLKTDVVVHMKAGNKVALTTVRNVLGEIETREKGGKMPVEFDDAQVTTLLQKEAAKRRDTAKIYADAGEGDRAAAEISEAEVIEAYLPQPLDADAAAGIVDRIITGLEAEQGPLTMRQMGLAMKPITAEIAGRFDGKAISEMVRKRLQ